MILSAAQPYFAPYPGIYPQLWGEFIGNLSTFDLLFCCGPRAGAVIRQRP